MFYGLGAIREIIAIGERADNSFTNVNTIGMMSANALVIMFYRLINKKFSSIIVLSVPCALMVLASGSRKAFVTVFLGIIALLLFRGLRKSQNPVKVFIRIVLGLIFVVASWRMLLSLQIMQSLINPMTRMINYFILGETTDSSVMHRMDFITMGLQQFVNTPLFGIGIGNSAILIGKDTYLHNNYIELLACGGMLGLLIYYAPYLYLLRNMFKIWRGGNEKDDLCLVLLTLILLMDFGQVSYFSKETYFYLILFFVYVKERLKNSPKEVISEDYTDVK